MAKKNFWLIIIGVLLIVFPSVLSFTLSFVTGTVISILVGGYLIYKGVKG